MTRRQLSTSTGVAGHEFESLGPRVAMQITDSTGMAGVFFKKGRIVMNAKLLET